MLIEMTMVEAQLRLPHLTPVRTPLPVLLRAWWDLGKVVLAGLLVMYAVGWVRDIKRVGRLEAEAPPPFRVITKYQAWDRIYRQPVPYLRWPSASLVWRHDSPVSKAR
jgi:hypothetical protein